jgi:hypothetical protein
MKPKKDGVKKSVYAFGLRPHPDNKPYKGDLGNATVF